jgi:hypothetical protein
MRVRGSILLALLCASLASGCTQTVRMTLACDHCFCSWASRDLRHPVSCASIDYEPTCCFGDSS